MTDQGPGEPEIRPKSKGLLSKVSFVWFIPILALGISLWVAWQSYAGRGVLISISFESASGVQAERTDLKFREVSVGTVESVGFSKDLDRVEVHVRVDRDVAPYLDDSAEFWIVQPEVSVRGISGLNTVLSGVYIEGTWDSSPGEAKHKFVGLDRAPLVNPSRKGTALVLSARDGNSIASGTPILYKGIRVGSIEEPTLSANGDGVLIDAFVEAPYNRLLTSNTRFWDISGISVSLGAGGVSLNFSSLASLVEGGVSFDTLVAGGDPVENGHSFQLFENEEDARSSLINDSSSRSLRVLTVFDGAVSGLTEGTAVKFRGLTVGEVSSVTMVAEEQDGRQVVVLNAILALSPARLGLGQNASPKEALSLLSDYVNQGLRARLASASILSSDLVVELVELPNAKPASIEEEGNGPPRLPTAESELSDFNATAEGVFKRINALPIEELLNSAQRFLNSLNDIANDKATRAAIPELTATVSEVRTLVPDIKSTLADARSTLVQTRKIVEDLREGGATEALNSALDSAANAADAIETAAGALPPLVDRLDALGARADAVLSTYADNSRLVSGALSTLRDISEASNTIRSLARMLQRNPNALIIGR